MYVTSSRQCNLPNSSTPMSAAAIAAQNARIAAVGAQFVAGNNALQQLNNALGGNYVDDAHGDAGVPTLGAGWRFPPAAVGQVAVPGPCVAPERFPVATVFPVPVVATPSAPPPPANPWGTVDAIANSAPVVLPPRVDCRTGDICRDLRAGCVLQSQVSTAQLLACSQAGYAGNQNLFPAIAASGGAEGGTFYGTPDPNPRGTAGMSGLSGDGSGLFWGGVALLLFSAYAVRDMSRSGRRR